MRTALLTADIEDLLGGWGAGGLESQEWEDFRASQAARNAAAAAAATATANAGEPLQPQPPRAAAAAGLQQQQQVPTAAASIPQVDGASDHSWAGACPPDEAAGARASPAAASGMLLPAPTHDRSSHLHRAQPLPLFPRQCCVPAPAVAGTPASAQPSLADGSASATAAAVPAKQQPSSGSRKRAAAPGWPAQRTIPQIDGAGDRQVALA